MAELKKGRGKKPQGVEMPKKPDGTHDKEAVKAIFMASAFVEWAPFAQSMGWNTQQTYNNYPTALWTAEKKEILARKQAEEVGDLLFNHRSRWHKEVLKTLRDVPETAETMMGILKFRMNEYIEMINSDLEEKKKARERAALMGSLLGTQAEEEKPKLQFAKVKNSDLMALSIAFKTLVEARQKSLLMNDWSVKVAEQFSTPEGVMDADKKAQESSNKDWTFEIIGGENISSRDWQTALLKWYDPPQKAVEAPPAPPQPEPVTEEDED